MILQEGFNAEEEAAISVLRARFWMRHPDKATAFEQLVLVKAEPDSEVTIGSGLTVEAFPRQYMMMATKFFRHSVSEQIQAVFNLMGEFEKHQREHAQPQRMMSRKEKKRLRRSLDLSQRTHEVGTTRPCPNGPKARPHGTEER